jgi:hypothetical protein
MSVAEVAGALDRSEAAVRQTAHWAREHVQARRPRFDADRRVQQQVTERFFAEQVLVVRNPDKLAGLSVTGSGTDLGSGG